MELSEKLDSNKMSAVQSFDMIVRHTLIDHEERIKKIEATGRTGETKHNCGDNCRVHNPTPTVERFKAYELIEQNEKGVAGDTVYRKRSIGEVAATRDNNGWWRLCNEPNKWSAVYSQEQYDWVVGVMLQSGAWERV